MSTQIYNDFGIYVDEASDYVTKIERIDAVIVAMEDSLLKAAVNQHITEYMLDDGQTKIRTEYRNVEEISESIRGLERVRQIYINRLNKRIVNYRDAKSLRYYNGRYYF